MVESQPSRRGAWLLQKGQPETGASAAPTSRKGTASEAVRAASDIVTLTRPSFDVLHLGEKDLIACDGRCLVIVTEALSRAGIAALDQGMARLTGQWGTAASISIVEDKATGTSLHADDRRALTEIARKYGKVTSASAVVCVGTGFRATAIRSVVTAIHMASSSPHPSKVFATPEPALAWLAAKHPEGLLDVPALARTVAALRAQLREQQTRNAEHSTAPARRA